jgi:hypothetical protein
MTQKPFPAIDLSDRIARESALISSLTDLDPDGEWQLHPIYQRRQQQRYGGITISEMDQLLIDLETAVKAIPLEQIRHWLETTRHQKPEDDAQTPSHEPATAPLA